MTQPTVYNLPNALTVSRLGLAVVLFVAIGLEAWWWCLVIFGVAALTDWLDGLAARLLNLSSALGRMLDPLVDKVLTCGAFICLLPAGGVGNWLLPWMVVVIVSREFLITGLRSYLEAAGVRFGADLLGKIKMILQCAALVAIFLGQAIPTEEWLAWTRTALIWFMLIATILSGVQYIVRGLILLGESPAEPMAGSSTSKDRLASS